MPVAFWLLPCEPAMQSFARTIDALARRFEAPRFMPHVTLHVDQVRQHADLGDVLDDAAARFAPFAMQAGPTGHSPARFKALFVTLRGDDIVRLAAALARGVARWRPESPGPAAPAVAYRLEPHLSLLYAELPEGERTALAGRNSYAGESICFDRITAVTPAAGARDFACVEGWRIRSARLLAGKNPPA